MIIVRLAGGLGNQMFQYATGRALSLRQGCGMALDRMFYVADYDRQYELGQLNVVENFLEAGRNRFVKWWARPSARIVRGAARRVWPALEVSTLIDAERGFDDRMRAPKGITWLRGFWQSEEYFREFEEDIRREFTFRTEPDAENASMLQRIRQTESVCVHVRRGDYVASPENNALHGTCTVDYYQRAIAHFKPRLVNPHWFIFSDDPEWARSNLTFCEPRTVVSHNVGRSNAEDLRLMMNCRHYVIANSSFSWWAAWLGSHAEKLVAAPAIWFAGDPQRCPDIVPKRWIRL